MDCVINYKVGDTFNYPIMGGMVIATITDIEFRVVTDGSVDHDSYYLHFRHGGRTENSHYKYLKNLKVNPNTVSVKPKFELNEKAYFFVDYMAGMELVYVPVTHMRFNVGTHKRIEYYGGGQNGNENQVFKSPEECIKFLSRKLKK